MVKLLYKMTESNKLNVHTNPLNYRYDAIPLFHRLCQSECQCLEEGKGTKLTAL